MVPLVGAVQELQAIVEEIDAVLAEESQKAGVELDALVGTMIELPRAALTAGQIAEAAEFFSFGTNDLTQTTWGFSRDDVEGSFFTNYLQRGVFGVSPFESLDVDGVGRLITIAAEEGRATRPDLKLGVCGEHGGDPDSVHFFHHAGLDYVSCSPFRVPVARLEAGRAARHPTVENDVALINRPDPAAQRRSRRGRPERVSYRRGSASRSAAGSSRRPRRRPRP
jgi:pyruvate,orthophosphate dikinase